MHTRRTYWVAPLAVLFGAAMACNSQPQPSHWTGGTPTARAMAAREQAPAGRGSAHQKSAPSTASTRSASPSHPASTGTTRRPRVAFRTSLGAFLVELYPDKAPITVRNFLRYVGEKFYDGTIFHRVMANFMIQGGGFTKNLTKKPTHAPIKNEADNGLRNVRGTLAMARTPVVDSATAQFFINVKDNPALDHRGPGPGFGYAVFGHVIQGQDVVERIRRTPERPNGPRFRHLPVKPVVILSVRLVK